MVHKVKLEIIFDEEYDEDAFYNMLDWHMDKNNWNEDDCIRIHDYRVIDYECD